MSLEALYNTGTVAVSAGSASIALTGGTWDTAWANREIQIGQEVYGITVTAAGTGTLDRAAVTAASGATYTLFRRKYPLAARMRGTTEFSTQSVGPRQIDIISPERYADIALGPVLFYTPPEVLCFVEQDSNLVSMVKFWPAPSVAGSVPYSGYMDAAALVADATAYTFPDRFLPAFQDLALAELFNFRKDYAASKKHEETAFLKLADLAMTDPASGGRLAKMELAPQRYGPTAFPRPDRHTRVR